MFTSTFWPDRPLTDDSAQRVFDRAAELAGLPRNGGILSLRHSFATHLLEAGVPLPVIQRLLGHSSQPNPGDRAEKEDAARGSHVRED